MSVKKHRTKETPRSQSAWEDRYQDEATSLAILSYECEWKRYESLLNASGRMIAGLSLVVVALVTALPMLLGVIFPIRNVIIVECAAVFLVLAVSLFMAVLMQFRYNYCAPKSPDEISNWLVGKLSEFDDANDSECTPSRGLTIVAISDPHLTLSDLNDKLAKFMDACVVLLLVAVGLIIVSIVFDSVFFLTRLCS